MPKSRIPSPARSQSALVTPRRPMPRGPRSVGSPARSNTSVRLTSVIQNFKDKNMDSFHLSPFNSRRSVLNDNTDIEEPKRNSWWKKLNESRDIMEVLENDKQEEPYNVIDEYMDVEVLSQEKKNPTLEFPDSSDNESISSIVIPQRKLFSQKENQPQPQKKFAQFLGTRESMAKMNKTSGASDKSEKTIIAGTKKLFGQSSKPRSKPAFPTELLRFSPDKTVNKTAGEIKGQVRNLFGNRAAVKRKNNFADFIASESEEEPEIQPKVFGFQKKLDVHSIIVTTASRGNRDHSPTSSVTTDIDMEDWKLLPSSTMVQTQLEAMITDSPVKKARLSKLSEGKESETTTNSTAIANKTKQSNKSITSKNKSKMSLSKYSVNKSKTSPRRNDGESNEKTVVNEVIPEQVDQEAENDENEVSLHYSDDDPQEDNMEHQNVYDATNKTKQSNKTVTSKNKSKGSFDKSKVSVSAQKSVRNEADVAEDKDKNINKSKEKKDYKLGKADDVAQEEEGPEVENEIQENDEESQDLEVEQENEEQYNENEEMGDENQESEVEQEDEEQGNESQEVEYDNQESDLEREDEEENESHEMEDENQASEVEEENAARETVRQEMEAENQESEVEQEDEEQENQSQELDTDAPLDIDEQNVSRENEVDNQHQEIEIMAVDAEAAANGSANKIKLSNQKTSPKGNDGQIVRKPVLTKGELDQGDQEVYLGNEENFIVKPGDRDAQDIENVEQNGDNDISKSKSSNALVSSKNNKTNISQNKSVASDMKSKTSMNKSKISPKSYKNKNVNENVTDEDQIEAEDSVVNKSLGIKHKKIVDESVENNSALAHSIDVKNKIKEQNQLLEVEEDEQEVEDMDEQNESQEVVNEEFESEGENEEEDNENEDEQNESDEVEVEYQSQEVEDQSQGFENDSQEVDNDEGEDDEENEEAEESEIEEENNSKEEIDEDGDDQQECNEMEESDGQSDTENDNHASPEEISGTDEGTPNVTHDTTGRNRKKNETNIKSPEAILHDNTKQIESFTAKGRNTSIRRTSMINSLNIRPSLAPPRESTGFSNSSAEGSGWDSHRITKKTLRQTFGRDFTPRKSLRALVMEKSAKRHTEFNVNDVEMPRANSTELPEDTQCAAEDTHDVSKRTRQTTLEMYLQKIKQRNMAKRIKLEEEMTKLLEAPAKKVSTPFTVPSRPFALKRAKPAQTKLKTKPMIPLEHLPEEFIEDMKYKPPRRFQPSNAEWVTKRLYKFLEKKLEAKYDYKSRIRAEKLVETLYTFTKLVQRQSVAPAGAVDALKQEMARLDVVRTHFEFYQFFHDYMPREVRIKVNPDVVNKIPLPRQGVFSDILRGNTVQG